MDEVSIAVLALAGLVFAVSAGTKLASRRAFRAFRAGLAGTALIPRRVLRAAAALLAGAEALLAAGLLAATALTAAAAPGANWLAETALAAATGLTGVLAAGVAVVIRRSTRAGCACFGRHSVRPLGRPHLARNLSLMAVTWAGLAAVPLAHEPPPAAGTMLAVAAGTALALVFIRWDDLAELLAPLPRPAQSARDT